MMAFGKKISLPGKSVSKNRTVHRKENRWRTWSKVGLFRLKGCSIPYGNLSQPQNPCTTQGHHISGGRRCIARNKRMDNNLFNDHTFPGTVIIRTFALLTRLWSFFAQLQMYVE